MTSIAGLGDDQRQRLARLLRRCAVQIQAGGTTGTGFFIAPQQVMTCRHVVAAAIAPCTPRCTIQTHLKEYACASMSLRNIIRTGSGTTWDRWRSSTSNQSMRSR